MSNLGAYQWITTTSKKLGGPVNLLLLTALAGAGVYKGSEMLVKECVKAIKAHKEHKIAIGDKGKLYDVNKPGKSNEDLDFAVGDQFYVLAVDDDVVLIEKVGDVNNPYFVPADLLMKISDYT